MVSQTEKLDCPEEDIPENSQEKDLEPTPKNKVSAERRKLIGSDPHRDNPYFQRRELIRNLSNDLEGLSEEPISQVIIDSHIAGAIEEGLLDPDNLEIPTLEQALREADEVGLDVDAYIDRVVVPLQKFLVEQIDLQAFERNENDKGAAKEGFISLNGFLYYHIAKNGGKYVYIHIGDAKTVNPNLLEGIKEVVEDGLEILAQRSLEDPELKNMERVCATSWLVARYPQHLKNFGFTIEGEIDEDTYQKHFSDDTLPVHAAFMTKQQLLDKYLKSE